MPGGPNNPRPLLLGHRGARAVHAICENTIQSFDRALADGCDGFEFDVRLTADRNAVICHDARHGTVEIAEVAAHQLPALAGLEQVLARFHDRAFLDIELKVGGLELLTIAFLRRYPPARGVVVSSFLPEVLRAFHSEDDSVPLGLICETKAELIHWSELPVRYVIPHYSLIDRASVAELKSADKKVLVWTVNNAGDMLRIRRLGVDGIISDDTELLCRTLNPRNT